MAAKPATLRLNGKPLDLNPPSLNILKIKKFLDAQSSRDFFTLDAIGKRVGVTTTHLRTKDLPAYNVRYRGVFYWGNPKAISTLSARGEQ